MLRGGAQDRERLLLLDCVYTFGERFTKTAETFLAGGRTVLLHSLAKGFLVPDVAGFAIGPAAEILTEPVISEHYRANVRVVAMNGAGNAVVPVRG